MNPSRVAVTEHVPAGAPSNRNLPSASDISIRGWVAAHPSDYEAAELIQDSGPRKLVTLAEGSPKEFKGETVRARLLFPKMGFLPPPRDNELIGSNAADRCLNLLPVVRRHLRACDSCTSHMPYSLF